MSIIDALMVLLDDQLPVQIEEMRKNLPDYTLQTISSTLGRLETKGWLKISKKDGKKYFQITSPGNQYVTSILAEIKKLQDEKWSGSWQIVVFNIPEKQRFRRDLFRQSLEKFGFGRLENSLWLSPRDEQDNLNKTIKELGIEKNVTVFDTGKLSEVDQQKIVGRFQWPWEELNHFYKDFINQAKRFLSSKKTIYGARLLVFEYAKILIKDPKFPKKISPKGYLGAQAQDMYQKIRPHCYKK